MRWLDVGIGECTDATGAVYSHGSVDATDEDACKSICEKGAPHDCVGINWVTSQAPQKKCMIQAFAGSTQGDIEKAIDTKFNWWWGGGVATDAIVKAENHGNGDWTATAPCWAAAPNILERPGGLGWSFVLLVLLGLSVYLVLGATRQRVIGSAERWPHADFWREMLALVQDGVAFSKSRGKKRPALLVQHQSGGATRHSGNSHTSSSSSSSRRHRELKPKKSNRQESTSSRDRPVAVAAPLLNDSAAPRQENIGGAASVAQQNNSTAAGPEHKRANE